MPTTPNAKKYPMVEYMKRGPFDEIATPDVATDFLIPHLHELDTPVWPRLWDSAHVVSGESKLALHLERTGFVVAHNKEWDFFRDEPDLPWDIQVTNPPYSVKYKWIERTMELGKPAALLLPITTIGPKAGHRFVTECKIVLLPRRIDFTGAGAPWFAVAWYLWNWPGETGLVMGYDNGEWQ